MKTRGRNRSFCIVWKHSCVPQMSFNSYILLSSQVSLQNTIHFTLLDMQSENRLPHDTLLWGFQKTSNSVDHDIRPSHTNINSEGSESHGDSIIIQSIIARTARLNALTF